MLKNDYGYDEEPDQQNIYMVTSYKTGYLPPYLAWKSKIAVVNIVQQDVPKARNGNDPDDDAVRAQRANTERGLKRQPVHKEKAENGADLQTNPKPALELSAS